MFAFLSGVVAEKRKGSLVVGVGGIGYEVFVTEAVAHGAHVDSPMILKTAHIIREDSQELFGFTTDAELSFFEDLLKISGVGPRTALGVLELASVSELVRAIAANDAALLMRAAGIGRKTAERIIIELREKASPTRYGLSVVEGQSPSDVDALDALVELGFPRSRAREVLREVSGEIHDPSDRVKAALKILGKK